MKKFLPKSINNPKGFTLIELLIVITIIAVLMVIAIVIFGNVQPGARDARRRSDLDAIGKALEAAKGNLETYPAMATSMFASGVVPTDPTRVYCAWSTTANPPVIQANPAVWIGTTCVAPYVTLAAGQPVAQSTAWKVCASLEVTGVGVVCRQNQQ